MPTIEELREELAELRFHTVPSGRVRDMEDLLGSIIDKLEELEGGGGE